MRCRGEADYNTSLGVNSRCFEGTDDGPKGEGDTVVLGEEKGNLLLGTVLRRSQTNWRRDKWREGGKM